MASGGAPQEWDFTLLPFEPIIVRLLESVSPQAMVEVGADRGDFTRVLLDWASDRGTKVVAIDPEPAPELEKLSGEHPELNLVREPSPEALAELPPAEVVILDGDHNHYTLTRELELIAERSRSGLPLLIIHDVGWPHARRDTYYAPDRIPEEHRQPLANDVLVAPGEPGPTTVGVGFEWAAEREGGPRNGVRTAVEDFVEGRPGLRHATIPAFWGLAVLWPEAASWSSEVAATVEPWASSPMLERLEEIRIAQIIDRTQLNREEELLRAMLNSRAFAVAEGIARVRSGGSPPFSRERVRRVLGDSQ